jgi:hypothetical protein
MLSHRSTFIWTLGSWYALWRQSDEQFVRLLSENGFDSAAQDRVLHGLEVVSAAAWSRLELLLRIDGPSQELAECVVRECCRDWRPGRSVGDGVSHFLLSLHLRASRVFKKSIALPPTRVLERMLGPREDWEARR